MSKLLIPVFLLGVSSISFCYLPFFRDPGLQGRYTCLALFALLMVLVTSSKDFSLNLTKPQGFYLLYVITSLLSALWAFNTGEAIYESSKIFMGFLVFLAVGFIFQKEAYFLLLIKTIILINLGYQLYVLYDLLGIGFNVLNDELLETIIGLNGQKNQLSIFLFLTLPFLAIGTVILKNYQRTFAIIALVGTFILILVLQTRSVWVGLFFSILIMVFFSFSDLKLLLQNLSKIWWVIGIGMLCMGVIFLYLASDIAFRPNNLAGRLSIWENTLLMFLDHPFTGIGAGNWKFLFATYGNGLANQAVEIVNGIRVFQRPHNDFLGILSELGLIGFTLLSAFLVSLIWRLKKYISQKQKDDKLLIKLLVSFTFGYLIISFFTFPKERIEHLIVVNIIFGLLHFMLPQKIAESGNNKYAGTILKSVTVLLLAGFCYIGFLKLKGDYYMQEWSKAYNSRDFALAKEATQKATSSFYNTDYVSFPIMFYEGLTFVSNGELENGLIAFEEAYRINPSNLMVINNLGTAYEVTGNREVAKIQYKKAIKISPEYDDARLNLASILYQEGNFMESLDWFNQIEDESVKRPYLSIITEMEEKQ